MKAPLQVVSSAAIGIVLVLAAPASARTRDITNIPTPSADWPTSCLLASGMNNNGAVPGCYTEYDPRQAASASRQVGFVWDTGVVTSLGSFPGEDRNSTAKSINDNGQVVGESSFHSFLWPDGVMTDLYDRLPPDSCWETDAVFDINDAGQITGYGQVNPDDGSHQGLLMTIPADLDQDGDLDLDGFELLQAHLDSANLLPASGCAVDADLDGDDDVDAADFAAFQPALTP